MPLSGLQGLCQSSAHQVDTGRRMLWMPHDLQRRIPLGYRLKRVYVAGHGLHDARQRGHCRERPGSGAIVISPPPHHLIHRRYTVEGDTAWPMLEMA